jgi:hypothetical protein
MSWCQARGHLSNRRGQPPLALGSAENAARLQRDGQECRLFEPRLGARHEDVSQTSGGTAGHELAVGLRVSSRLRRRWASFATALLAAGAVAACSGGDSSDSRDMAAETRCPHRALFAGLAQVTGRAALCPGWFPNGSKVLTSHASDDPPAYVVEFGAAHVVLSFGADDLPGDELESVEVNGRSATVLFNAPDGGEPGLHSGHYVLELPSPVDSRGAYSVSLHGIPWQSRQQNMRTLVRIAEALTPVSSQ